MVSKTIPNGDQPRSRVNNMLTTRKVTMSALNELKESGFCGLHMWERCGFEQDIFFNRFSHEQFTAMKAKDIDKHLGNFDAHKHQLISTALLMPKSARTYVRPWLDPFAGFVTEAGYLVDLRQTHPHPARVLRVSTMAFNATDHPKRIRSYIDHGTVLPGNYYHYSGNRDVRQADPLYETCSPEWAKECTCKAGSEKTAEQVKALIEATTVEGKAGRKAVPCNELLIAAGQDHIAAICVPLDVDKRAETRSRQLLGAALAGLQQIKFGVDRPVVGYMTDNDKHSTAKVGELVYIGRGKDELNKVANKALGELGFLAKDGKLRKDWESDRTYMLANPILRLAVNELLDIAKPKARER